MFRAVEVRAEDDSLVTDLTQVLEAEDLEAATVRQDGAVPTHESMEASHPGDEIVPGSQIEVIGVRQDDVSAHLLQLIGSEGLHGGLRSHWHESRGRYVSVRRVDEARAGRRTFVPFLDSETKRHSRIHFPKSTQIWSYYSIG